MNITLERPNEKRKYSFLTLVEEFKFNEEDLIPWVIGLAFDDFASYLKILDDGSLSAYLI